jgi:SAM-dependent methyltransferase
MNDSRLTIYTDSWRHASASGIIRQCSTNQADIREVALEGLDLGAVRSVLDLGCGFGFMAEVLVGRIAEGANIIGIDAGEENRDLFLSCSHDHRVEFIHALLEDTLPFDTGQFDLVIASYSLYFFIAILPEVARVLRPSGTFIVITHSHYSFTELYELIGVHPKDSPMWQLINSFSSEKGEDMLTVHFERVERIEYPNCLVFDQAHLTDLLDYVRFKLPLIEPEQAGAPNLSSDLQERFTARINREGQITVTKNDVVFRCTRPRCS